MASIAQIQANRSNAQESTGPRTAEGKATASHNAVKHGLLAEQVVIHGEDPAQFDLYREGMLAELGPQGAVEEMLAERAVSLAWRLRRAERLQSAVFATVYRENADDIVLWPRHGLAIEPKPDEEEVILGQVVMTDFARAQVLDRLLVYERRIESSLYRTMAQLRKEQEARKAAEASLSQAHREVNKVNHVNKVLTPSSKGGLAVDREPAARAELASFGESASEEAASDASDLTLQTSHLKLEEEKITPCGVTTNEESPRRRPRPRHFTIHSAKRSQFREEARSSDERTVELRIRRHQPCLPFVSHLRTALSISAGLRQISSGPTAASSASLPKP
jgi:ferritin-like metal-binding protein YciE